MLEGGKEVSMINVANAAASHGSPRARCPCSEHLLFSLLYFSSL